MWLPFGDPLTVLGGGVFGTQLSFWNWATLALTEVGRLSFWDPIVCDVGFSFGNPAAVVALAASQQWFAPWDLAIPVLLASCTSAPSRFFGFEPGEYTCENTGP